MGNHNSRMSRGSTATINDDPCLDNLRQWHTTSKNDPYKRQYPLPSIANDLSNNRIKPRKQSSPAAVNRRSFTRFLNFRQQPPLILESTSDEMISKPTSSTSSSLHSQQQQQPDAVHPLAAPVNPCSNISLDQKSYKEENIGRNMDPRRHQRHHSDNYHQSTTTSSSINNTSYRMSGKRKYHDVNGSHYLLPCDEEEVDRLHLAHFMVRFAIQGNYLAPVSDMLRKGARVLDLGCGPGAWAMEIAGEYPKSSIIGIDMTPMFPREIKPTNCAFYQYNVLEGIPFDDDTFDYVFMRFMGHGIESEKWEFVFNEIIRVLKPNGWMELVEADNEIYRPGPITKEFNQRLIDIMVENKQDPYIGRTLKERLLKMDQLTQVSTMFVSCPGGQWAGKLGQLTMQSWKAHYQAFRPLLCESWSINDEEYNQRLKPCWREADEFKTFENVHFAYAKKKSAVNLDKEKIV